MDMFFIFTFRSTDIFPTYSIVFPIPVICTNAVFQKICILSNFHPSVFILVHSKSPGQRIYLGKICPETSTPPTIPFLLYSFLSNSLHSLISPIPEIPGSFE